MRIRVLVWDLRCGLRAGNDEKAGRVATSRGKLDSSDGWEWVQSGEDQTELPGVRDWIDGKYYNQDLMIGWKWSFIFVSQMVYRILAFWLFQDGQDLFEFLVFWVFKQVEHSAFVGC